MIGEYLFYNNFPDHAKSVYCNGRTYTRDEYLIEKKKFLKRKAHKKVHS